MTKLASWLKAAYHAGSTTLNDKDPQKRVILGVNLMALLIIVLDIIIGTTVYFINYSPRVLAGIIVQSILLVLPLWLNHRGRTTFAGMVVYIVMGFATLYYGCLLSPYVNAVLMIPYLMAISLFMFNKRSLRLICGGLAIFILIFLDLNNQHQYIRSIPVTAAQGNFEKWLAYFAILSLIVGSYLLYSKSYRTVLGQIREYARLKESESENKDKFISNASHEMRVSFKSIFAIINILKKRLEPSHSTELATIVSDLQTSCDISQNIIDNILEYEKIQVGINTPNRKNCFDAKVLFSTTTDIYRYLASEKNIRITGRFDKSLPRHIIADDIKIRHIYTNLLHNAIKFSPNDSEITIAVRTAPGNLVFRVEDCGEGIADPSRIFEAFASTNPDGLGLGLYIVKEHVHALHGQIEVVSGKEGTAFTVGIPLSAVHQPAALVQQETLP
ncbi:MAG TPA: HAMP domain-containing sensor histidine kinase [Puia sp.]|nr:HAMP domain-containing sensor histidine kinase [Puia sp.]